MVVVDMVLVWTGGVGFGGSGGMGVRMGTIGGGTGGVGIGGDGGVGMGTTGGGTGLGAQERVCDGPACGSGDSQKIALYYSLREITKDTYKTE